MKSQGWKDMMDFSSREKRGVIVLLSLLLILIVVRLWQPWDTSADSYDFTGYEAEIDGFVSSLTEVPDDSYQTHSKNSYSKSYSENKPCDVQALKVEFDPNTVSVEEMESMGFGSRLIRDIDKYRNAGGSFYSPEDMKKLYNMEDEFFTAIEPYINIPESSEIARQYFHFDPNTISKDSLQLLGFPDYIADRWCKFRERSGGFSAPDDIFKLYGIDSTLVSELIPYMRFDANEEDAKEAFVNPELNTCEYKDLIKIPGLDRGIASKVLSYRKILGGYVSYEQLKEVYDMDDENFNLLISNCEIDQTQISRISLNDADFGEFIRHPYLDKKDVNGILRYRDFQKEIKKTSELLQNKILSDTTYQKVESYLSID